MGLTLRALPQGQQWLFLEVRGARSPREPRPLPPTVRTNHAPFRTSL